MERIELVAFRSRILVEAFHHGSLDSFETKVVQGNVEGGNVAIAHEPFGVLFKL